MKSENTTEKIHEKSRVVIRVISIMIALMVLVSIFETVLLIALLSGQKVFSDIFDTTINIAPEKIVGQIILLFVLCQVRNIFKLIQQSYSPFTLEIAERIRKIAVLTGVSILLFNVFAGLLAGFVIYCMSMIFAYGCELQKEVDETL